MGQLVFVLCLKASTLRSPHWTILPRCGDVIGRKWFLCSKYEAELGKRKRVDESNLSSRAHSQTKLFVYHPIY